MYILAYLKDDLAMLIYESLLYYTFMLALFYNCILYYFGLISI